MRTREISSQPDLLLIIETGEDLIRMITDTCLSKDISSALIEGSGSAMSVTLSGGPAGRRRVAGPMEVVAIHGTVDQRGKKIESDIRIVASREMDTGLEMVGGVLLEGQFSKAVVRLARHHPVQKARVSDQGASWSAVAQASAELDEPEPEEEEKDLFPKVGDTIDHPKFGQCTVRGVTDDHIRIRLQSGRFVSLGLSHLTFYSKGELSTEKHVFGLKIEKK